MKMKKYLLLLAVAAVAVSSCSDLLEPESSGNLTPDDFENMDQIPLGTAMMGSAVLNMHNGGSGTASTGYKVKHIAMDMYGNDMILGANGGGWFLSDYLMNNYRGQTDSRPIAYWEYFYKLIYKANQVIDILDFDAIANDPDLSSSEKATKLAQAKNIYAQALTMRAFSYYHLITVYQDAYLFGGKDKSGVPYYTIANEKPKGRGTAQEVYNKIYADCNLAITYFKEGSAPKNKEELSLYAAEMVLARTALTIGDYATAATAADVVVQKYGLMDMDEALDNGFQKIDGTETIWGYKWSQNTSISNNAFASHMGTFISSSLAYGSLNSGYKMMDTRLYLEMSNTDWRGEMYISGIVGGVQKYCIQAKYPADNWNQDEVFMRASEAHFIKAEALALQDPPQTGAAQQALYDIMITRDADYEKSTNTGEALLEEIRVNKRIEMWGEGLEFFDNKRINKGVNRAEPPSLNQRVKTIVPAGKDFTFRLPLVGEIERNPEIKPEDQNPL